MVSVAKTLAAEGEGNPVNTFAVTELLSKVIAALTFNVPSTPERVAVAYPVKDRSLGVAQAVAVSEFPVKSPVTFPNKFL